MLTLIHARCGQMGATESNMFDEVSSETRRKGVCYPSPNKSLDLQLPAKRNF